MRVVIKQSINIGNEYGLVIIAIIGIDNLQFYL